MNVPSKVCQTGVVVSDKDGDRTRLLRVVQQDGILGSDSEVHSVRQREGRLVRPSNGRQRRRGRCEQADPVTRSRRRGRRALSDGRRVVLDHRSVDRIRQLDLDGLRRSIVIEDNRLCRSGGPGLP